VPTPVVLVATPTPVTGLDPHELRIIEVYRRYLVGGDILTAIDGVPLASWDDLRAYLDEQTEVSQAVRLTLWRDGQPVEIDVVLGQEPF
jgi:S1-C subfamily serine protease